MINKSGFISVYKIENLTAQRNCGAVKFCSAAFAEFFEHVIR